MLLKANKYRKDKKADCRQNELGSRIFEFFLWTNYSRRKGLALFCASPSTSARSAGSFGG